MALGLLERERELDVITGLVDDCVGGAGAVLLIEGAAGIGKTALIGEAGRLARGKGLRVLGARGSELEQEFAFGVARQLFERTLRNAAADERSAWLAGAAGLAGAVIAAGEAPARPPKRSPTDSFAALHGLYWLTANLAESGPLLLAVDDAQWCDRTSLGFLLYLGRRVDDLGVGLVLGIRQGEHARTAGLLGQLRAEQVTSRLNPGPLSHAAVGELVRRRLGDPDGGFVEACHRATGGNPFLVSELVDGLARDEVKPVEETAARVGELGPATVAHSILLRLSRLPAVAGRLARAVAVLGDGALLRYAAALARVSEDEAVAAVESLAAVGILGTGPRLEFVHPLMRAAIYEDLSPVARAAAHAEAARLLSDECADPEQIASQLLVSGPAEQPAVVGQLRRAARAALGRGAPDAAAIYLRRALTEPPRLGERPKVLRELGSAEMLARDPQSAVHLKEALELTQNPVGRAEIAAELSQVLAFAGDWDAGISLIESALRDLGDLDEQLSVRLQTLWAATAVYDPRFAGRFEDRAEQLRELAERSGTAGRELMLLLAAVAASRGGDRDDVVALVERGLDGGRLIADEGAEAWILPQAGLALLLSEELDRTYALAHESLENARRRGSAYGVLGAYRHRGWANTRAGALSEAEADLRAAIELAREHGLLMAAVTTPWCCMDAVLERTALADVAQLVAALELPPPFDSTMTGAALLEVRGRVHLLQGNARSGCVDLRRCGEIYDAIGFRNPNGSPWRSALALALADESREEASRLVNEELELARAAGLPRAQGVALRAAGLLEANERRIELITEAATVLEGCPSRLEQARTQVELGAALRRAGRRAQAREPLRAGLELARRIGAERLATRAEQELSTAGAKPRRLAFSGVEALTASERRVAELAAGGLSNRQVAQALFLTAKTVENHLGRAYHKLGIHSRDQLADALRGKHVATHEPA